MPPRLPLSFRAECWVTVFWEEPRQGPFHKAVLVAAGPRPSPESPVAVGPVQSALLVSPEG